MSMTSNRGDEVREAYKTGRYTQAELARRFQVSPQAIHKTVSRLTERALPLPPTTVPTYLWPEQRHLIPKRCTHCVNGWIYTDPPTAAYPVGSVTCLICSREHAQLKMGAGR